jgi:hypothetical protein
MRLSVLTLFILLTTSGLSQDVSTKMSAKDTVITCALLSRQQLAGPFQEGQSTDFEKLVDGILSSHKFQDLKHTLYRTSRPGFIGLGKHKYDDIEQQTFLVYSEDAVVDFNVRSRSRFGLASLLAHLAGHHHLNHFANGKQPAVKVQELQSDYFAGFVLAGLDVSKEELANGLKAIAQGSQPSGYPTLKEREAAMRLGFAAGQLKRNDGPLASLASGKPIGVEFLKRWARVVDVSENSSDVRGGVFEGQEQSFILEASGQLVYQSDKNYVIARAVPSRDRNFRFVLFDNLLNTWTIDREGVMRNSSGNVMGQINLSILQPSDALDSE